MRDLKRTLKSEIQTAVSRAPKLKPVPMHCCPRSPNALQPWTCLLGSTTTSKRTDRNASRANWFFFVPARAASLVSSSLHCSYQLGWLARTEANLLSFDFARGHPRVKSLDHLELKSRWNRKNYTLKSWNLGIWKSSCSSEIMKSCMRIRIEILKSFPISFLCSFLCSKIKFI